MQVCSSGKRPMLEVFGRCWCIGGIQSHEPCETKARRPPAGAGQFLEARELKRYQQGIFLLNKSMNDCISFATTLGKAIASHLLLQQLPLGLGEPTPATFRSFLHLSLALPGPTRHSCCPACPLVLCMGCSPWPKGTTSFLLQSLLDKLLFVPYYPLESYP